MTGSSTAAAGILRRLWAGWKRLGKKIGDVEARVLLTAVYFVVVAPFALAVRRAADPLALKPATPRGWHARTPQPGTPMARALRQF